MVSRACLITERLKLATFNTHSTFTQFYTREWDKKVRIAFKKLKVDAMKYGNTDKIYENLVKNLTRIPEFSKNNISIRLVEGAHEDTENSTSFVTGITEDEGGHISLGINRLYTYSNLSKTTEPVLVEFVSMLHHEYTHRLQFAHVQGKGIVTKLRRELLNRKGTFFGLRNRYTNQEVEINAYANAAARDAIQGNHELWTDSIYTYFLQETPRIQNKFIKRLLYFLKDQDRELIKVVLEKIENLKKQAIQHIIFTKGANTQ